MSLLTLVMAVCLVGTGWAQKEGVVSLGGTRNRERMTSRAQNTCKGLVDITPGSVRDGMTLWFNSSRAHVATYCFQACDILLCPQPSERAQWFHQCYGTAYICVTSKRWGWDCEHWGAVGWSTNTEWGYKPQEALDRRDHSGKPLLNRMTLTCKGEGEYMVSIENPGMQDAGVYVFGLYWGNTHRSWRRSFYLKDMDKGMGPILPPQQGDTKTPEPASGHHRVSAIANPTYEDTLALETGFADTNLWVEWLKYTAQQHNRSDCYICASARPHLGTVPLNLPTNLEDCLLSLFKNVSYSSSHRCADWYNNYRITEVTPGARLSISATVYPGNYTCYNLTGDGQDVQSFPPGYCQETREGNQTLLLNTTRALGDVFWLCGDLRVRSRLPPLWRGQCALTKLLMPFHIYNSDLSVHTDAVTTTLTPAVARKHKRALSESLDPHVYINWAGVPTGVPEEYKARDTVGAFCESIFPMIGVNKNAAWINYLYYNQQRFVNYTREALAGVISELGSNTQMTMENRMALDMLLAEKGGVCRFIGIGDACCTYIPRESGPGGMITRALSKLNTLSTEIKANSGTHNTLTGWLTNWFGDWSSALKAIGTMVLVVLLMLCALACCVVPLARKMVERMVMGNTHTLYQGVEGVKNNTTRGEGLREFKRYDKSVF